MSLDITLSAIREVNVFDANITHNVGDMADKAGIYKCLWHPKEANIKTARQLIEPLKTALKDMKARPEYYKQFNAKNGWGLYKNFVPWLENLLKACEENPDAEIDVSI